MKKSPHAQLALVQNGQFRARIARKKCGYFNEIGRKYVFLQNQCNCDEIVNCWKGGGGGSEYEFEGFKAKNTKLKIATILMS